MQSSLITFIQFIGFNMPYYNQEFGIVFVVVILLVAIFATLFPERKE